MAISTAAAPQFQSPLVRALAWSCFSETLITEITTATKTISRPHFPLTQHRLQWLHTLDNNNLKLKTYLNEHCHSTRLGLVFESLWHFFLQEDPDTELIAHNIPVRSNKVTLGEFDLIYYCHQSNRYIHLELAVKFFLGISNKQSPPGLDQWFGPNRADRLDRKLARLSQHQLPLAYTEAGQEVISTFGIEDFDQEIQVSGTLFHDRSDNAEYAALNPNHQRGDWLNISEFESEQSQCSAKDKWRYIEKPSWLGAEYNSATQLSKTHLEMARQKPIMLIDAQQQRRFLVADDWAS
ncbi:Uncharacterised protein [Zhongshania aliphaticivorans]|uniref:DUF1853 family protein n=1 Tax=Zhongshania aliphaticivorans TaxID=1470434 RepID=A0A5S9QAB4_9GAMM|nr:DUF1853 family protein [Zhongshania aliphaticivorans]CAA0087122.1 Uncharacterised protein [Zhongshania aliphaticivorans]CAA0114096.1 Uncharacterised protein [Zhongshania aliphaticivorans]